MSSEKPSTSTNPNRHVDFNHMVVYDSIVRISVLPKTSWGRWSASLIIAYILFFALSDVLIGFEPFGPGFNPVLALALTIVLAGISGAAFVTGLISMIKSKERSAFVFLTTARRIETLPRPRSTAFTALHVKLTAHAQRFIPDYA